MITKRLGSIIILALLMGTSAFGQVSLDQIKTLAPELIRELGKGEEAAPAPAPAPKEERIAPEKRVEISETELSQIEKLMLGPELGEPRLAQFGYSVFSGGSSAFAPPQNLVAGPEYVIGPGDSFTVTMWGIAEGSFRATVNKEGEVTLPKAGVVSIAGLRYGELKNFLTKVLSPYYQSINLSVNLEGMRSIRIYILGEVNRPGSYLINPLTGVFNALYLCEGPTKKGTLREIKIIRRGATIATVDLYNFLLNGNKAGDILLEDGDTIFIPLIGKVVGIAGNVCRPAIYEVNDGASLKDLFYLAGGLMPTSYLNRVQIQRVVAHEYKTVLDISVAEGEMNNQYLALENLDTVRIFPIYTGVANVVFLQGAVKQPGTYELKPGLKVKDLVPAIGSLIFMSNLDHAELIRINPLDKDHQIIAVNLRKLYAGDTTQNYELKPLDRLIVYTDKKEEKKVTLNGEVKVPGAYTIEEGETLSSVIERAGGFTDKAFLYGAVFTRRSAQENQQSSISRLVDEMERRVVIESSLKINAPEEATIIKERYARMEEMLAKLRASQAKGRVIVQIDIPERLKGTKNDVVLEDGDSISIPPTPSVVSVLGEVYDSNSMLYEEGKKGSYYIDRVGGLNKNADRASIYIVRANGSVLSSDRYNVFTVEMARGDTIIVPQKMEIVYDFGKRFMDSLDVMIKAFTAYALVLAVTK